MRPYRHPVDGLGRTVRTRYSAVVPARTRPVMVHTLRCPLEFFGVSGFQASGLEMNMNVCLYVGVERAASLSSSLCINGASLQCAQRLAPAVMNL